MCNSTLGLHDGIFVHNPCGFHLNSTSHSLNSNANNSPVNSWCGIRVKNLFDGRSVESFWREGLQSEHTLRVGSHAGFFRRGKSIAGSTAKIYIFLGVFSHSVRHRLAPFQCVESMPRIDRTILGFRRHEFEFRCQYWLIHGIPIPMTKSRNWMCTGKFVVVAHSCVFTHSASLQYMVLQKYIQ